MQQQLSCADMLTGELVSLQLCCRKAKYFLIKQTSMMLSVDIYTNHNCSTNDCGVGLFNVTTVRATRNTVIVLIKKGILLILYDILQP